MFFAVAGALYAATFCHHWLRVLELAAREVALLTEAEVQRSFRNLFKGKDVPPETYDKAEALLDELRNESPLRHRLSVELEELRKMHSAARA